MTSRPDLDFVGEIAINGSDDAYSDSARAAFNSIAERVQIMKAKAEIAKAGARHSRKDTAMLQTVHDHAVALGASCSEMAKSDVNARIAKVDESLGLVFGYAIVCTKNGQPYYDLNIDKADDGTLIRVPEHIPEEAMLKAAVSFMQTARAGNEMHAGPDVGTYVFAFPLTAEIAKAFGIQTNTTGLMIAYKPPPEVFAKFKDGSYTGFSIEGSRVTAKMMVDGEEDDGDE